MPAATVYGETFVTSEAVEPSVIDPTVPGDPVVADAVKDMKHDELFEPALALAPIVTRALPAAPAV